MIATNSKLLNTTIKSTLPDMTPPSPRLSSFDDKEFIPPKDNYVSENVLEDMSLSLGSNIVKELPYGDDNKITFRSLFRFLANRKVPEKDESIIDKTKTDMQIINEQMKILFDIKDKAIQSSKDGQTRSSRDNIGRYIKDKISLFDSLAHKASFNNRPISNDDSFDLKVGATRSDNIGATTFQTGDSILEEPRKISLSFIDTKTNEKVTIRDVEIGHTANTGLAVLSEAINDEYDKLKIKASWRVESTAHSVVKEGKISNFIINGIRLGTIILDDDRDMKVMYAINNLTRQTGVNASLDARGHLVLSSLDGRGIVVEGEGLDTEENYRTSSYRKHSNYGKLTLIRNNTNEIKLDTNYVAEYLGFSKEKVSSSILNLRHLKGSSYNEKEALSIGVISNKNSIIAHQIRSSDSYPASTTTYSSSLSAVDIIDSSIIDLRKIKNDLLLEQQSITNNYYAKDKSNNGLLVNKEI